MAEENEDLELTEITDENNNDSQEDTNKSLNGDNLNSAEENNEKQDVFAKKDKTSLIKKILIGVVALLVLILLSGVGLYFMGFFDTPEIEDQVSTDTKTKVVEEEVLLEEDADIYKFNIKDINSKKLNKQLAMLTNKNLQNEEENDEIEKIENEKKILKEEKKKQQEALALEEEKLSEEKALLEKKKEELEKQKNELEALRQEALLLKEQMLKDKELLEQEEIILAEQKEQIQIKKETIAEKDEEIIAPKKEADNSFIMLINVAKIKGALYKSYLNKIIKINTEILLCRDDKNRIEIYYGPFESENIRKDLYKKLQEGGFDNSFKVELTKQEFNKRCNY